MEAIQEMRKLRLSFTQTFFHPLALPDVTADIRKTDLSAALHRIDGEDGLVHRDHSVRSEMTKAHLALPIACFRRRRYGCESEIAVFINHAVERRCLLDLFYAVQPMSLTLAERRMRACRKSISSYGVMTLRKTGPLK